MEDFVIRELAVKLKEKGFNWNCVSFYPLESFTGEYVDSCGDCYEVDFEKDELYLNYPLHYKKHDTKCLPAPTISQVLKWLREKYSIHISTKPYHCVDGIMWLYEIRKFNKHIIFIAANKTGFIKEEQAAIEGISYALDNLI